MPDAGEIDVLASYIFGSDYVVDYGRGLILGLNKNSFPVIVVTTNFDECFDPYNEWSEACLRFSKLKLSYKACIKWGFTYKDIADSKISTIAKNGGLGELEKVNIFVSDNSIVLLLLTQRSIDHSVVVHKMPFGNDVNYSTLKSFREVFIRRCSYENS